LIRECVLCVSFVTMPLFETLPIDQGEVELVVLEHWSLKLGKCLKASQNHTFLATSSSGDGAPNFIIRVTPDPAGGRRDSLEVEVALLDFLSLHDLPVCTSVPTRSSPSQKYIRTETALFIVAFEYALGEPVDLLEWRWLERESAEVLGRWYAQFHHLSKLFAVEHPSLYSRARKWTELHDSILADAPIHQADMESSSDPNCYGVIHGDVNASNFFWDSDRGGPHMFDWDQAQISWFLYDLSSPIFTVVTVSEGGNPIDKTPVPQASVSQYTDWLVSGYESGGGGLVDRSALQRMVDLRRLSCKRFCKRAVTELPPDSPIAQFCQFMNTWL